MVFYQVPIPLQLQNLGAHASHGWLLHLDALIFAYQLKRDWLCIAQFALGTRRKVVVFNGLVWLDSSRRLGQILFVPVLLGLICGVRAVFSPAAIAHF